MSTTKMNLCIVSAAARLGDQRDGASSAYDTGATYNSELLTRYFNQATRDFLIEKMLELGVERFAMQYPEYVKSDASLVLSSGSVLKPTEAWTLLSVFKSDYTIQFLPLEPEEVAKVKSGGNPNKVPSATKPYYYEENGYIKTLGLTSGTIVARYIKKHLDLDVVEDQTASESMVMLTAGGYTFTHTTKNLSAADGTSALNRDFASTDVGKKVVFYLTADKVRTGRITAITEPSAPATYHGVTLTGDGLPSSTGSVYAMVMFDYDPENQDVALNENELGNIIDRMVQMGLADAMNLPQ